MPSSEELPEGATLRQPEASLDASRAASSEAPAQDPAAPKVPGYVLTRLIGEGAYAQVWRGWQARTRKTVAVKVFRRQDGVDWTFLQREVERLIRLDKHPNVVSLLDANLAGDPAYYAMDLMEGGSLQQLIDSGRRATPEEAARWMEDVARALAYVHSKGVIHCDLKPANLLLDDEGRVRVADFGQSRILTESSGALGTLYYMAPEQALTFAQGDSLYPDVRWDVYALGATIYAALAGAPPRREALREAVEREAPLAERLRAYREGLCRTAAEPLAGADAELGALVEKCISPWMEQRYRGPGELLEDLRARREGRPVGPLSSSRLYRARKWFSRNRLLALVLSLATAGLGASGGYALQKHRQLRGRMAFEYALLGIRAAKDSSVGRAQEAFGQSLKLGPSWLAQANAAFYRSKTLSPASELLHDDAVYFVRFTADGRRLRTRSAQGRDELLWDASAQGESRAPEASWPAVAEGWPKELSLQRGDSIIANPPSEKDDGSPVLALDPETGARLELEPVLNRVYRRQSSSWRSALRMAALYAKSARTMPPPRAVPREFGPLRRLRPEFSGPFWRGELRHLEDPSLRELNAAAFSPIRILTAFDSFALLWDPMTGRTVGGPLLHEGEVRAVALNATGSLAATGALDGTARVWDALTGRPLTEPLRHRGDVHLVRFSPDSSRLLTASSDRAVHLWDAARGVELARLRHGGRVSDAAFSPDGRWIAASCDDGMVRLWDRDGLALQAVLPHPQGVNSLAFSPDSLRLATGSVDRKARIWELPKEPGLRTLENLGQTFSLAEDGTHLIGSAGDTLAVLDFDGRISSHHPSPNLHWARASPDGRLLAVQRNLTTAQSPGGYRFTRELVLFDLREGKELAQLPSTHAEFGGFSGDGRLILTMPGERSKALLLRDARTGEPVGRPVSLPRGYYSEVALLPDARTALLMNSSTLEEWDLPSGKLRRSLPLEFYGSRLTINPAGTQALLCREREVLVVDLRLFAVSEKRLSHEDRVTAVAFSPDGRSIATGAEDGSIRLWDAESLEPIGEPIGHAPEARPGSSVSKLHFAPDQSFLLIDGPGPLRLALTPWLPRLPARPGLSRLPVSGAPPEPPKPAVPPSLEDWKALIEQVKALNARGAP